MAISNNFGYSVILPISYNFSKFSELETRKEGISSSH